MWGPTKSLGLIGSPVLTSIVYRHPDRRSIYIWIFLYYVEKSVFFIQWEIEKCGKGRRHEGYN